MKKVYLFLAYGFEEVEALTTVDLLRRAGAEVITVSVSSSNAVTGSHKIPVITDIKIDESAFDDADAIVLPGGLPGVDNLKACAKLSEIIKKNYLGSLREERPHHIPDVRQLLRAPYFLKTGYALTAISSHQGELERP